MDNLKAIAAYAAIVALSKYLVKIERSHKVNADKKKEV